KRYGGQYDRDSQPNELAVPDRRDARVWDGHHGPLTQSAGEQPLQAKVVKPQDLAFQDECRLLEVDRVPPAGEPQRPTKQGGPDRADEADLFRIKLHGRPSALPQSSRSSWNSKPYPVTAR